MWPMNKTFLALVLVGVFALVGCSSPSAAEPAASTAGEGVASPVEPAAPDKGTDENPWPAGSAVPIGDWEITINSWEPNANDAVSAAGDDMSMLAEGQQYAILNVTMTWTGEGLGDNSSVMMDYIPVDGDTVSGAWSAFGTTPGENKLAYAELVSGGSVTGDMLYSVDAGNTDGVFMLGADSVEVIQYAAVS